ncbi:hypothetical protein CDAR_399651 [Caerostris darwini]|uniref:Uncharacterized protein n=1 Tax=Caerostris darwini TaxID=1538125 RepID=A0AAV4RNR9_9ARAC|nr:hypothetical protein CDAR_399651 [Caerostris darwini]
MRNTQAVAIKDITSPHPISLANLYIHFYKWDRSLVENQFHLKRSSSPGDAGNRISRYKPQGCPANHNTRSSQQKHLSGTRITVSSNDCPCKNTNNLGGKPFTHPRILNPSLGQPNLARQRANHSAPSPHPFIKPSLNQCPDTTGNGPLNGSPSCLSYRHIEVGERRGGPRSDHLEAILQVGGTLLKKLTPV